MILPGKKLLIPRRKILTGVAALSAARVLDIEPSFARLHGGAAAPVTITPPTQAAAVGFNTLSFHDEFTSLSTIDLANTQAPGFNWYISQNWPNANDPYWTSQTPISPTCLSQSGSILNCGGPTPAGTSGTQLSTACAQLSNPSAYNGNVFTNGFYAEASMAWNVPSAAGVPCPAWWSFSLEPVINPTFTNYYEIDFFEHFDNTAEPQHFAVHQWFAPGSSTLNSNFVQNISSLGLTYTNQNIYGCRWVPMAQNGGVGKFDYYVNNTLISAASITYSTGSTPSPAFSPTNSTGLISGIDAQHQILYLGWGAVGTIALDYVRVWQL
jgi:hypothetical protein